MSSESKVPPPTIHIIAQNELQKPVLLNVELCTQFYKSIGLLNSKWGIICRSCLSRNLVNSTTSPLHVGRYCNEGTEDRMIFEESLQTGETPDDWRKANVTPIFKKENDLMSDKQHGFREGRSCLSNLLTTLEDWTSILDDGDCVDVAYLDFKKAFDLVSHKHLLLKLQKYEDDSKIYCRVPRERNGKPELEGSHELLQNDLNELHKWATKWKMSFNVNKCKVMHLGYGNPRQEYELDVNTPYDTRGHSKRIARTLLNLEHQSFQGKDTTAQYCKKKENIKEKLSVVTKHLPTPRHVYLNFSTMDKSLGRVVIKVNESESRWAQQLVDLCVGQTGERYSGSTSIGMVNKGEPNELFYLNSYLTAKNEKSDNQLYMLNQKSGYPDHKQGRVIPYGRNYGAGFCVLTRKDYKQSWGGPILGDVVSGFHVMEKIMKDDLVELESDKSQVKISESGLVIDLNYRRMCC
ncbi:unnamed protein product, partial [Meganyctiphanes norvegica]